MRHDPAAAGIATGNNDLASGNAAFTGYYGAHALRLFNYPMVVGVLETAQVISFCMAATLLRRHVGERWGLLSQFVLFPMTFYGINFGLGAPVLVAINMPQVNPTLVLIGSVFSIVTALGVVIGWSRLLPVAQSLSLSRPAA